MTRLSKQCSKCKNAVQIDGFPRDHRRKIDGRGSWCLSCMGIWREANRKTHRAKCQAYYQADPESYKQRIRLARIRSPLMKRAHERVRFEIKMGRLVRPDGCGRCGRRDLKIEAHHFRGYECPLDIQWLCKSCHRREEVRLRA